MTNPITLSPDEQEALRCGARLLMAMANDLELAPGKTTRAELAALALRRAEQARARAGLLYRLAERAGLDIDPVSSPCARNAGITSPAATAAGAL